MRKKMRTKKRYSNEEKVMIVREYVDKNIPVSDLADKYNVHPNAIYKWKKQLFESASDNFTKKDKLNAKKLAEAEKRIKQLESTLSQRETLIAEIVNENIELKKNDNGVNLTKNGLSRM
jgi:transposase